jgi:hypothetical protein
VGASQKYKISLGTRFAGYSTLGAGLGRNVKCELGCEMGCEFGTCSTSWEPKGVDILEVAGGLRGVLPSTDASPPPVPAAAAADISAALVWQRSAKLQCA